MINNRPVFLTSALAFMALFPGRVFALDAEDVARFVAQHRNIVVTKVENGAVYARSDRVNILIEVSGRYGDVSYVALLPELSGHSIDRNFLNSFNRRVKFGRAYVLVDGDVAIQMDRNAEGGITRGNIEADIDVFVQLVWQFMRDINGNTGV